MVTSVLGAGIGLKPQHYDDVLALPAVSGAELKPWFEVHTENYFVAGGPRLDYLTHIRERHAVSFHGVGASLGGEHRPEPRHLKQVKALVDRFEPALVSEHAVWSSHKNNYFAELLPMPKTHQALAQLIQNVDAYQSAIGRQICIENPTNYLPFKSELDEPEFLVEAAQKSGCQLLLDVNNLYLSSKNCGLNAYAYVEKIPPDLVGEIHIAGFDVDPNVGGSLLIDSHAADVAEPVWSLLQFALTRFGQTPVLLERDDNIPEFRQLWAERSRANGLLYQLCNPISAARAGLLR
jgi:uncharacterized protein (UPF0276 family)